MGIDFHLGNHYFGGIHVSLPVAIAVVAIAVVSIWKLWRLIAAAISH